MILDTSFLISFYAQDDKNHQTAVELMKAIDGERLLILDQILGETATVLLYKKGIDAANKFIETVTDNETITLVYSSEIDFYENVGTFQNQKKQLSFIDASLVNLALKMNDEILTFDENMKKELERLKKS
jgi:predicted nucleic acid-binding protein